MSTLTLDFTDSSFDDGLNNDGITEFVLSNQGGGLGVFEAGGPMGPNDAYAVDNDINVAAGISAMEITTNSGAEFTFEFHDEDDSEDRSTGDEYSSAAVDNGNEVFNISMNEAFFADGLDITNGDSIRIDITEKGHSSPGTPGATTVSPVDVTAVSQGGMQGAHLGTLGHNGTDWVFDTTDPGSVHYEGDWGTISTAMMTATNMSPGSILIDGHNMAAQFDPSALLVSMTTTTKGTPGASESDAEYSFLLGDEGGNGGETTWVVSGDLNGRDGTATDDSLGFRAGNYDGVFLGGDGFDTLVFNHELDGDGQLFLDLSSGIGMFGNGQASPLVQFAEIGNASYDLDWERLETEGSSNDFVIVGGGIGSADDNTGLTSSGSAIVDGFFELSLGMGEDQVFVNDASTGITLDLSGADHSEVELESYSGGWGEDASSEAEVYSSAGEDSGYLDMNGQGDGGVIDYIYAGDNNNLEVETYGEDSGVVVDFGLHAAPGGEDSFGEDGYGGEDGHGEDAYHGEDSFESYGGNDAIDLRGMDSVEIQGEASDATILVKETVGAGGDAVEMTARITSQDVESIFVTQSGDDGDTDVLVDMSHLYGEDAGVLGQGVDDVSGGTYDVATSAHLDSFGSDSELQIYYDGDHNAFVDSNDALTWTNSETHVAHDVGVSDEQKGWGDAIVANDTGGAATPSFYVEIAGQKVAVYLDQTDGDNVEWKVDTSAFAITSDASIYSGEDSGEDVIETLEGAYGVSIDGEDLAEASNVYLNASESDIEALLGAGNASSELDNVMDESAYDFGFYTQVKATTEGGDETFVNVAVDYNHGMWSINPNATTRVQTDYNTVSNGDGSAAVGGLGSDFVELGSQAAGDTNIAMGNGGSDTYKVGSGDEGVINELGNLNLSYNGMGSDSDAVQFELVNSIDELTFTRTKIAGEKDGSTLQIDAGAKGSTFLFDQYNDFLDFRKTEFLVIDDGATRDEVFALVTDGEDSSGWENEIYVAHGEDAMSVDLGGTDYVFLGDDQANTVLVDLDQILSGEDGGSVSVTGIEQDNLQVNGSSSSEVAAAYATVKADADSAEISWDGTSISIEVYDDNGDAILDQTIEINYMV